MKARESAEPFSTYVILSYKALAIYRNFRHFPFAIELHDTLYFITNSTLLQADEPPLLSCKSHPNDLTKLIGLLE